MTFINNLIDLKMKFIRLFLFHMQLEVAVNRAKKGQKFGPKEMHQKRADTQFTILGGNYKRLLTQSDEKRETFLLAKVYIKQENSVLASNLFYFVMNPLTYLIFVDQ